MTNDKKYIYATVMASLALVFVGASCANNTKYVTKIDTPIQGIQAETEDGTTITGELVPLNEDEKTEAPMDEMAVEVKTEVKADMGTKPAPSTAAVAREIKITAFDFGFEPSTIKVKVGEKIKLTLTNKSGEHGIGIPAFGVSLKVAEGATQSAEFTADKAGTYPMFCNVFCGSGHRDMKGTLIVE